MIWDYIKAANFFPDYCPEMARRNLDLKKSFQP